MTAIVVHGGAGRASPEDRCARDAGVTRAAEAGWHALAAGRSALEAVVEAVAVLEDDPHFNAGRGAVLNALGAVELDASVMTGDTLGAGAVGAVAGVANPVRLAHALLLEARDVLLVGESAASLAARYGLPRCTPEALVTDAARQRWRDGAPGPGDTVGAVACDGRGHVAAATSTGGVSRKRPGRVGDSAVIGAGTYADDLLGAGSATGPGEAIIRLGLVRLALDLIGRGADPARAARHALDTLERRLSARAGIILVDGAGRIGVAHTTEAMAAAYRTEETAGAVRVE